MLWRGRYSFRSRILVWRRWIERDVSVASYEFGLMVWDIFGGVGRSR